MKSPIDMALDGLTWTALPPREVTDGIPVATHEGVFVLGTFPLRVYRLSDGRRIIDADDLNAFFARDEE